ncbi:MAG: MerC domain-containing protein, partial [Ignavibacteria bacterium]
IKLQMIRNNNMIKTIRHTLALKLDSIGFIASTLCAIHCAAMPFLLLFFTLYGLQFIANPLIEFLFISSSVIIGIFTFSHGYFNHHKRLYPFTIFALGLSLVIIGHYFFHDHNHVEIDAAGDLIFFMIAPLGAVLIGLGHYLNRRLSRPHTKTCQH